MKDLLIYRNVSSEAHDDLWVLNLGSNRLTIPYQLGFEVLGSILLACKMAMNYEQVASKHWRELAALATWKEEAADAVALNRGFRRSMEQPNVRDVDVAYENQLVRLEFHPFKGEMLTAKVHFSDAFKLYRDGRIACRTCKRWAGDSSRIFGGHAHLMDAEEFDKVIAH